MMKFFYLMYYKYSKLKVHLVKSYLILFLEMDLFDTLTRAIFLENTTFLDTPTLTVLMNNQTYIS
jgi:hypothetical protein